MTYDLSPRDAFQPTSKARFGEPAKFLPVGFVLWIIAMLWSIYTVLHCFPLLAEPDTRHVGIVQMVVFNTACLLLMYCYVKCILTHPGTIPEKDEAGHSEWDYVPHDLRAPESGTANSQETKRSGDRRHCKWCNKYKPDRCHHCRVCRTCILRMDHHCPWIYNCVGFKNHKYFFLLLSYSAFACDMIVWSMYGTVHAAIAPETPFLKMFLLLFGETLACFMGFMVTVFFSFHIWLMLKAMTTIEFCEKSMKRTGYDSNTYDRGLYGNIKNVLGDVPWLWLLPCSPPSGDGLGYVNEEAPLIPAVNKGKDAGRDIRKQMHESNVTHKHRGKKNGAGTGECAASDASGQESDSLECEASPSPDQSPRLP